MSDATLSAEEQAGSGPFTVDCQAALDDYLATLGENSSVLSSDTADRSFELARLYTQGYLARKGDPGGQSQWRQFFRGRYLSGDLERLDTALEYGASLRTLGSSDRDAWFAQQVLSEAGQETGGNHPLDGPRRARTGTDANERSLALGINYDLAQLSIGEAERIGLSGWMLAVAASVCLPISIPLSRLRMVPRVLLRPHATRCFCSLVLPRLPFGS